MPFCSLIKGITQKIRVLWFCPNKQLSFEPFYVFVSCLRTLAFTLVSGCCCFIFYLGEGNSPAAPAGDSNPRPLHHESVALPLSHTRWGLTDSDSALSFPARSSTAASFYASLLLSIDGVIMSLALCPQLIFCCWSFRSSGTQATCDDSLVLSAGAVPSAFG